MKKKLLVLMFMLMLVPCLVKAENVNKCAIISGDGTNIGDEVACGTEHFYVLSNDGEEIKMLSKYNLYVGRTYYKVEFDQTFDNNNAAMNYFYDNYEEDYDGYISLVVNDDNEYYGMFAYRDIDVDEVKQSSKAIGAHGDERGNPLFPEVAVSGKFDFELNNDIRDTINNGNYDNDEAFIDFDFINDSDTLYYLNAYKQTLLDLGLETSKISILSVNEINDLVYSVTEEELPLYDWYDAKEELRNDENYYNSHNYYILGSIKDSLPDGYDWLWSTTYWTRTAYNGNGTGYNQYFVDTLGYLCATDLCNAAVGAGIRPVITMSADNLIYNIETKTDGNGTVVANKVQGVEGEEVEFVVEAMEGYQLKKVVVTTSTGQVLEFTDYRFTMPNTNVEIYAEFEKIDNPNTGLSNPFIVCGSILGIALIGTLAVKKKKYI